jgi:GT2 family glycosyltransferase
VSVGAPLLEYALKGLRGCWQPEHGRWSHIYHLDGRDPPNQSIPSSDVFYTLNVLLGLSRVRHLDHGVDLPTTFQRNVVQLETLPVPKYAFGMALWTAAELELELPGGVLRKIKLLLDDKRTWETFRGQDLGMVLCGVVAQARRNPAEWSAAADELLEFLLERFHCKSGLFFDCAAGPRRRYASFATQTYLTLSCYDYGQLRKETRAVEIANQCTLRLLELQGPNGEWPWFFDVPGGRVLDLYEVYSVHQYGMAPAFLQIAERLGVPGARAALIKGFMWVVGENQLHFPMLVPETHMSIRSQVRKGELWTNKIRMARAVGNSLLGRKGALIDASGVELRLECRSYELGWILWSFGQREDIPELTHHRAFADPAGVGFEQVERIRTDAPRRQVNSGMPLVSVIIPHLNQPEGLAACLKALHAQTLDKELFEVIVVDNGSVTMPNSAVAEYSNVRLLQELKPGPGPARNRGVLAAQGEVFAFIDADCRAHPDWLRNALHSISGAPARTILGGRVCIWRDNHDRELTGLEAYESIFAYRQQMYIQSRGFSGTGNLVVRRSDFEEIGPFGGIMIAEDIDWGNRACSAGFRFLYAPDMIVSHAARESLREMYLKWDRHIQHTLSTAIERPFWRIWWGCHALAILGSSAIDGVRILFSDQIHGATTRVKALAVLVAVRSYRSLRMLQQMWARKGVVWNRAAAIATSNEASGGTRKPRL